jgi:hypothetical protein
LCTYTHTKKDKKQKKIKGEWRKKNETKTLNNFAVVHA